MPKDSFATRSGILSAAVQTLQQAGVEGFTLDAVARRAGVVKGLVLYHYASRGRLLRAAGDLIAGSRDAAIAKALAAGTGMKSVDACWEELRRQAEDGTTRAWLSLCASGLVDRSARNLELEEAAQIAAVDGCAVALASGIPLADTRDVYNALCLALIDIAEPA